MRRVVSVGVIAAAVLIAVLFTPGEKASAAPQPNQVQVVNVPLPVTVDGLA